LEKISRKWDIEERLFLFGLRCSWSALEYLKLWDHDFLMQLGYKREQCEEEWGEEFISDSNWAMPHHIERG
jgi:hypothetical protein